MSHTDRPAIAVVGAGPSGLFACQALLRAEPPIGRIDVYDRLPTPYGLLRYGVAPDHVGIKSVASRLATVFEDPRVRYFGLVEFGRVTQPEREQGEHEENAQREDGAAPLFHFAAAE